MADEPLALTVQVSPPTEADYDAILNAVMETERGRWFLLQYARRNRNADTRVLLSALDRIEAMLRGKAGGGADGAMRAQLERLGKAVAQAKAKFADISASVASVAGVNAANDYEGAAAAVSSATAAIGDGIEHLQEIAWFMHESKLDAALCANLEATTREIAGACTLLEQADQGMRAATALIMEMEARLAAVLGGPGGEGAPPPGKGAGATATGEGGRPASGRQGSGSAPAAGRPQQDTPSNAAAEAGPPHAAVAAAAPASREGAAAPAPARDAAERTSPPSATPAAAATPAPPPPPATTRRPQPSRGWLSQLLARNAQASAATPAPAAAPPSTAAAADSGVRTPSAAAPATAAPPPTSAGPASARGPLAQVAAMSDEEKIALFS
jgi:hypothetical protein